MPVGIGQTRSPLVGISVEVPLEVWEKHKTQGWKWRELILLGISAKNSMPQTAQRLRELEEDNERLQKKISEIVPRLWELENERNNRTN